MALGDAEIAEIKSKIPAQFRPASEAGGLISIAFQNSNAVGALRAPNDTLQGIENPDNSNDPLLSDKAREWAGMAFIGNAEATASFVLTGAQAAQVASETKTEKDKKDKERQFHDQIMSALNQRLAELNAELAIIDIRLEEIRLRRAEIGDSLEAVDELSELVATGKLDPNNPAHAALLRRAGLTPEDAKRKDLADVLKQRRTALSGEDGTLEGEWNDLNKRKGERTVERDKVAQAINDGNSAKTPKEIAQAEASAREAIGDKQYEAITGGAAQSPKVVDQFYGQNDEFDLDAQASDPVAASPAIPKP